MWQEIYQVSIHGQLVWNHLKAEVVVLFTSHIRLHAARYFFLARFGIFAFLLGSFMGFSIVTLSHMIRPSACTFYLPPHIISYTLTYTYICQLSLHSPNVPWRFQGCKLLQVSPTLAGASPLTTTVSSLKLLFVRFAEISWKRLHMSCPNHRWRQHIRPWPTGDRRYFSEVHFFYIQCTIPRQC